MRGFSLIEIIIVVVILGLVFLLAIPAGVRFLKTAHFLSSIDEITAILRRSRENAMNQERDSAYGVSFAANQFILFKGSSFAGRDPLFDEAHDLPAGVTVSAPFSEVVFAKATGIPSATGDIIITSSVGTRTISVNSAGRIALVPVAPPPAGCTGTPAACSAFLIAASCTAQQGCSWSPTSCTGTYQASCGVFTNKGSCQAQSGCTWNPGPKTCTGTYSASCSPFGDQTSCQAQSGCTWNPAVCAGSATPCGSFSDQTSCQAQQGCTW